MIIYIDPDYKCYVTPAEDRREVETDYFDGKCDAYIEGYCYVPAGENWILPTGEILRGEMAFPWKDHLFLYKAQLAYDVSLLKTELEDADAALTVLGVNVDG